MSKLIKKLRIVAMKILLLGGTGAMGNHLAKVLSSKNNEVHITSRRKIDSTPNVCYIQGNAHDLDFTLNLLDTHKYDCVVDFMVYNTLEFLERVDLLLDICVFKLISCICK